MRSSYGALLSFLRSSSVHGLPLVAVLALAAAAACSESFPESLAPPSAASRFDTRPSNTTCRADVLAPGRIRLEPAFQGYEHPLRMIDRPDRGLLYVGEMAGRLKVLERATGKVTTALDLDGKLKKTGESLMGVALHPTKPYVYLTVEREPDATTPKDMPARGEIIRFTSNDGGKTFDPTTETLILRIDRPFGLHPPGTLEFGPDGFLYIGVGESAATTPYVPDKLLGSILRIDVDGAAPYAIPPDNPYANGGGRPEIFAGGFRNPWRFTFDRATGEIWEGDVGQDTYEEINKVEKGKNYGWPTLEGNTCIFPPTNCDRTGLAPPVFVYPHSEGGSVTGGYVYRGKLLPDLVGKYIYADFTVGHVRMLEGTGESARAVFLNPGGPKPLISSFGEDADGELYALGWDDGILYKLVPGANDAAPTFPALLSQTGCVDPKDPKVMAPGVVPYGVNVELWSDGADKRRFVAIPDGTTIKVEADGDMTIPRGSVVLKEFAVDGRRIETRLIRLHTGGEWTAATYEWNDAQTDAVLLETAKNKVLPNGQTWPFPSPVQCFVCHKKAAGTTLGLETLQLNRDFAYAPGQSTNQLGTLSDIGYLDRKLDPAAFPRLPELTGTAPAAERARAYLHANCAMCHREDGGTGAVMEFRFDRPFAAIKGCTPSGFPGADNVKILSPGDPSRSSIYLRMTSRDLFPMPPLGSRKVDDLGTRVVADWIRSLTTCE